MRYNFATEDEMSLLEADLMRQRESELKRSEFEAFQMLEETYREKAA